MSFKIENIRLGHACNSSSTHSILLMGENHGIEDDITELGEYGWDFWVAASEEAKVEWALYGIYATLARSLGDIAAQSVMMTQFHWLPGDGYVDHQSTPTIISKYSKLDDLSLSFAKAFIEKVKDPRVVIVGGNDNTDEDHWLQSQALGVVDYHREGSGFPSYRWRVDGDLWTIFNRATGARTSMSWGDNVEITSPMLADVKITDWCNVGCKFCYQSSTEEGLHGDINDIKAVFKWLGDHQCFEVALGGGEPTSHPQFIDIIRDAKSNQMNVNITTRNFDYFKDVMESENYVAKYAVESLSAVAVSVESLTAMERWLEMWPYRFYTPFWDGDDSRRGPVLTFQVIDGLVPPNVLAEMDKLCGEKSVRITVLGYKTTGFGINVNPPHKGAWVDVWKNSDHWYGIQAIDTVIAQQYDLEALGIDNVSVIDTEGIWSKYYDCTGGMVMVGPSSYAPDEMEVWNLND